MNEQVGVPAVVGQIIEKLSQNLDSSSSKRNLANLRNSIGKDFSQAEGVWSLILEQLPKSFLSKNGIPTYEENAILNALQLYALHQQGKETSAQLEREEGIYRNMGASLRILRTEEKKVALDRRFNTMITASTYRQLVYHLTHMIRLLRKEDSAKADYILLSNDLFWFQKGKQDQMRLRWAQSYYYTNKKEKTEENKNE